MTTTTLDAKTPKMFLKEVFDKKQLAPLSWSHTQTQTTPPVFHCSASGTINNEAFRVEGHGANKKDAEQCVALKLIPKVVSTEEFLQMTTMWKQINSEEKRVLQTIGKKGEDAAAVASDDEDEEEIIGEPIGQLKQLCDRLKLHLTHEETSKMGADKRLRHYWTATVDFISTRTAKSARKQDAKRLAHFRVLQDLKSKGYTIEDKKGKATASSSSKTTDDVSSSQAPTQSDAGYSAITLKVDTEKDEPSSTASINASEEDLTPASHEIPKKARKDSKEAPDQETEVCMSLNMKRNFLEAEGESNSDVLSSTYPSKKFKPDDSTCSGLMENCLRYVKDLGHVFQHLPPTSHLEEALMPTNSNNTAGSMKVLETWLADVKAKLKIYRCSKPLVTNSENKTLVFFTIILANVPHFEAGFHKRHTLTGVGKDYDSAKDDAAYNVLNYIRDMRL